VEDRDPQAGAQPGLEVHPGAVQPLGGAARILVGIVVGFLAGQKDSRLPGGQPRAGPSGQIPVALDVGFLVQQAGVPFRKPG
jgi:hypothetical protein